MEDKNKLAESRRKLLKTVAAGGGAIIAGKTLPEKWGRPVVDSVMLPAHAVTSHNFAGVHVASIESDSMFARALDTLVPPSQAGTPQIQLYDINWCITPTGEKTADVFFLVYPQDNNFSYADLWSASDVEVGSTPVVLTNSQGCSNALNVGSGGEWLDNLGLVNDAQAASAPATVTLSGLDEGDNFRFVFPGDNINFVRQLNHASCGSRSVFCPGATGQFLAE